MTEFMIAFFLIFGAGFIFIASLGVLRMPELYMRIHSATKAGTLGVGFLVAAVAIYFQELSILIRALAAISFIVITAPVAAHMIGRAGYKSGVPLWKGSIINEIDEDHNSSNSSPS